MPLIKADQSVSLFKSAIVLDMNDVTEQAEQIKLSARQKAEQLINDAQNKAKQVSDDHASEGYERGYADGMKQGSEKGYQEGFAKGEKEGHAQAVAKARKQFNPLVAAWKDAGQSWDEYHGKLDLDARDSVIELALRLTEKMIHRQLQVDRHLVIDQVTSALKLMTGATRLAIHINPDDKPAMQEVMSELLETFGQFKQMNIIEDANIGRGGCILVHEYGKLNATLETQLQRAVELLLPGELILSTDTTEEVQESDHVELEVKTPEKIDGLEDVVDSVIADVEAVESQDEQKNIQSKAVKQDLPKVDDAASEAS